MTTFDLLGMSLLAGHHQQMLKIHQNLSLTKDDKYIEFQKCIDDTTTALMSLQKEAIVRGVVLHPYLEDFLITIKKKQ